MSARIPYPYQEGGRHSYLKIDSKLEQTREVVVESSKRRIVERAACTLHVVKTDLPQVTGLLLTKVTHPAALATVFCSRVALLLLMSS